MTTGILNPNDLLNYFDGYEEFGFSKATLFTDGNIGFSIQKNYRDNGKYKPFKTAKGEDDTVALIKVTYYKERTKNSKTLVLVSIGVYSIYLKNHFDYNYDDQNSPTKESIEESEKTKKPPDLMFFNEFYFDNNKNSFCKSNGGSIEGLKILNSVYKIHTDYYNWKRRYSENIRNTIHNSSIFILKTFFGLALKPKKELNTSTERYKQSDLERRSVDSFDIFGYRSTKNTVVTFCYIVIMIYLLSYFQFIDIPLLSNIAKVPILSFTFSVVCIHLLSKFPFIILFIINLTRKY